MRMKTPPFKNVYKNTFTNKWHARIITEKHDKYLTIVPVGEFDTFGDAHAEADFVLEEIQSGEFEKRIRAELEANMLDSMQTNLEWLRQRYGKGKDNDTI